MDCKYLIFLSAGLIVSSGIMVSESVNAGEAYSHAVAQANIDQVFSQENNWTQPVNYETVPSNMCGEQCCQQGCSCGNGCSCGGGCHDDLMTRTSLTNGLWGLGQEMAENGIVADLQMTQFYQGVSSGGSEQDFRYGGKMDYIFTFLGGKLGLNEGFNVIMHAESRFGDDINLQAGALALPNTNMLYPSGSHVTSITGLMMTQALNEKLVLTAGKYNLVDLWNMLYPNTGRGIDGFMNTSMIAFPTLLRTTNLSFNGAGMLVMEGKQVQGAVLVYDTNNSSTTVGLDDLFDQGAVVLGYWRFFHEINGLAGSNGFVGNWSSRAYTSLEKTSWTAVPGQGVIPGKETGSWTLSYVLDQIVWADRCNSNRNVRFMGQVSLADSNPNFYGWAGNIALQGSGLVHGRENDIMGVGYFYDELNSSYKSLTSPIVELQNIHGFEMYYNAAITPWFHLTADLQVVQNAIASQDTAVIPGLRANIKF
jgi:porin